MPVLRALKPHEPTLPDAPQGCHGWAQLGALAWRAAVAAADPKITPLDDPFAPILEMQALGFAPSFLGKRTRLETSETSRQVA